MCVIRPIQFATDAEHLRRFLGERDRSRLPLYERAADDGDVFVLVAEIGGLACGWVVVHLRFRPEMEWGPEGGTIRFQQRSSAYLENLEICADHRSRGAGRRLLKAAETEARRRGKTDLYLHVSATNVRARRFYERFGWDHRDTVTPPWNDGAPMWVCHQSLGRGSGRVVHRQADPAAIGG